MSKALQRYSTMVGFVLSVGCMAEVTNNTHEILEEVIVTAEKREQSLQETPIAISVLNESQLAAQGISSLAHLMDGTIPSLQVRPFPDDPAALVLAIRGNGPGDVVQITREGSVAVYVDEIYLGRAQGLYADLVDLKQIEVLRGPQGTFFGRNATGGAINATSKKPSGEFGVDQTIGVGRFDEWRSLTHLDLPEIAGVRAKFSYLHSERDGWVDNTASGEWDYNAYDKDSGRLSLDWQINDVSTLEYSYNQAQVEASQIYFQFEQDIAGDFGDQIDQPGRQTKTRYPIAPLDPTVSEHYGHALTFTADISENLSFKSLTSYNELDNKTRNNYGGSVYYNGLIFREDIEQKQQSQEFRVSGHFDRVEFTTGLFYYREQADEDIQKLFSFDIYGFITGTPLTPIDPPTTFDVFYGIDSPLRTVESDLTSVAVYGQATWTPPVLNDRLNITLGLRHTKDEKTGTLAEGGNADDFDLDTTRTDPTVTFNYQWRDGLSTYAKWGTAFRGGGISSFSSFSEELQPFEEEKVKAYEVGLKSEFWGRRARLNVALFQTDYIDKIIDIFDPEEPQYAESINAAHKVEVDGAELDFVFTPLQGLALGLSYTYLDGNMPLQPNPLDEGALVRFRLSQTPKHAGSLTLDYRLNPRPIGTPIIHLNITSTDDYHYYPTNSEITDAYTLMNARLTLAGIPFVGNKGDLTASLWVNNITDEEYATYAFSLETLAKLKAYGDPRTFGVDVTYKF